MSDNIDDRPPAEATEKLVIACPTDGTLNRVPRAKLGRKPICGRSRSSRARPWISRPPVSMRTRSRATCPS